MSNWEELTADYSKLISKLIKQVKTLTREREEALEEVQRYGVAFGFGSHAWPEAAARTVLENELKTAPVTAQSDQVFLVDALTVVAARLSRLIDKWNAKHCETDNGAFFACALDLAGALAARSVSDPASMGIPAGIKPPEGGEALGPDVPPAADRTGSAVPGSDPAPVDGATGGV